MDVEAAENVTLNETVTKTKNYYVHYLNWRERLFLETFSIVCLLNLAACVFICYAILKFKKLRSRAQNHYILHWHLMVGLYYLFTPNLLRLLMEHTIIGFSGYVFHIMLEMQSCLYLSAMIIVAILTADCIVSAYSVERAVKFRARYKVAIISVYVVLVACVVVFVSLNWLLFHFLPVGHMAVFLGYMALLLVMAIFNVFHLVKRKSATFAAESTLGLKLSNVFVACWLPTFISLVIGIVIRHPATMWFSLLGAYFAYCNPILNIFLLFRWDRYFKACFLMVFRCSSGKYAEDLEDLDGGVEEDVIRYGPDGVQVNK